MECWSDKAERAGVGYWRSLRDGVCVGSACVGVGVCGGGVRPCVKYIDCTEDVWGLGVVAETLRPP